MTKRSEGGGAPRMIDIARLAGVSRMAVSAVLMGTGQGRITVSTAKAERIREIAAQMGYRPNPAARQLAGQRSGVIALMARDWRSYLTQVALSRLHEVAESQGLQVLTTSERDSPEPLRRLMQDLNAGWIDGVIYLAHENESRWPSVQTLMAGNPRALMAVGPTTAADVSAVSCDVAWAAAESVRYLASQGRKRFAVVVEESETPTMQARLQAYRSSSAALNRPLKEEQIIVETKNWRVGTAEYYPQFDELARRIYQHLQADAVLCDTDFTASGLALAFRRLGIRVPEQVALVGWGNLQFAPLLDPSLTTVDLNFSEVFTQIISRLQLTFTEATTPAGQKSLVLPELIVRSSA